MEDRPILKTNAVTDIDKIQEKMDISEALISSLEGEIITLKDQRKKIKNQLLKFEQKVSSLRLEEALKDLEINEKKEVVKNLKKELRKFQSEFNSFYND